MSRRRELATAVLRELISDRAADASDTLWRSPRRQASGWTKYSLEAMAAVAEDVAVGPESIGERWWDRTE